MKLADAESKQERENRARRHLRIRRAKQFLRPLPRKATLHRWPILKRFANTARKRPHLWSFHVREVSVALYIGFVIALLPIFGLQFLLAFGAALLLRANLPVIMGAQLITNPATILFIYPTLGVIGNRIIELLGMQPINSTIGNAAYSTIIGGVVSGLIIAFVLDMSYRYLFYQAKKRPVNLRRMLKK